MGPTRWKINHKQPHQRKMNENEKNSKLRVFFWLVQYLTKPYQPGPSSSICSYVRTMMCRFFFYGIVKHHWLMNQRTVLSSFSLFRSFLAISGHFWPPPWALGFLKHLHKEPDVYIYPLAIAPAKKTPLIFNSFHFYSFFCDMVVSGQFFTWLGPFWVLAGGINSSKYDHI